MCSYAYERIWCYGAALIVIVLLAAGLRNPVEGWAVVLEVNDYPEGYEDLPVNFVDVQRMQDMLEFHGWQRSHMIIGRDEITRETVKEGIDFLKKNADSNDIALFYIGAHGGYIRHELDWSNTFYPLWDDIKTGKRMLIVDSCFAGSFLPESENPYIGIASVSAEETAWAGIPEEGLPIIGLVFTYYFCESMKRDVSVEEGFQQAVPQVREYMKEVVYPKFKDMYSPEQYYNLYNPHPVLLDQYPGYLHLEVDREAPVSIFLVFAGMLLALSKNGK